MFTVSFIVVAIIASVSVGVFAVITSKIAKKMSAKARAAGYIAQSSTRVSSVIVVLRAGMKDSGQKVDPSEPQLTTFEQNCIGAPFSKLFHDCDDIAYVVYNDTRCITVEAVLLTGYLYYGKHIYHASSVMLLLIARYVPSKVLRTFNVLLLRWRVDQKAWTLTHVQSCSWFRASRESHKLAKEVPVA